MLTSDLAALGGLALSAFLAATLLPGGSEAVLAGLLVLRPELGLAAVLTAMTGLEYFRKALPFLREDT